MTSRALINPLPKNSGVSLRATIQNPRPRKYASDADRQKAFRERQAMIQVRVAPKAIETFDEIAETLGYSRQEVVYALLMKGLMSLGNWETVGLPVDWQRKMPQFKLPRYEENPMKRKPTPAQLAARERFAEMARSGAFKRKAKATTKRKKNPAREGIGFEGYDPYASRDRLDEYRQKSDAELYYIMKDAGEAARAQRGMSSEAKYLDQVNDAATVLYERKTKRRSNPAKKTVSQKISQLVREGYPQPQAVAIALSEESKGKVRKNPAEAKERKPRVVLITNPKQRMGLIAFRTAGGALTTKEVPILFSFKLPVAANLYGEKSTMDFFAHKDGREIAVTEKTTGFKLGNIPRVFMAVGRDEKAAAKYFVEDLLKQHGAAKFRAAVESKPKIA